MVDRPPSLVRRSCRPSRSMSIQGHRTGLPTGRGDRSWPSFHRRQPQPRKIRRKGGRRPSRVTRSALAGDLARLHSGASGGWPALAARAPGADRCGAEPVRRAAGTARAPTPPGPAGLRAAGGAQAHNVPPKGSAPDRELRCTSVSAHLARRLPRSGRARRAPRALEDVKKVVTTSDNTRTTGGPPRGSWRL
jgi:hypothetical protein